MLGALVKKLRKKPEKLTKNQMMLRRGRYFLEGFATGFLLWLQFSVDTSFSSLGLSTRFMDYLCSISTPFGRLCNWVWLTALVFVVLSFFDFTQNIEEEGLVWASGFIIGMFLLFFV